MGRLVADDNSQETEVAPAPVDDVDVLGGVNARLLGPVSVVGRPARALTRSDGKGTLGDAVLVGRRFGRVGLGRLGDAKLVGAGEVVQAVLNEVVQGPVAD